MIDIIINPVAGNGRSLKIGKEIEAVLNARQIPNRVHVTTEPLQATQLAKAAAENHSDTVLSVGGDGTAFEVACGLTGSDVPLGIIPAGTGNDFIKSLGTPKEPIAALDFILSHPPRAVDIGILNDRMFLNCCGVGFDVMVLDYSLKAKKYVRGLLPYLYGVIRTIFTYKPVDITYKVDGGPLTKASVLICSIANGKYIGGGIPIAPPASVDDGLFDLVTVDTVARWKIPFYLPGLMMGKVEKFKVTKHTRCKKVTLICEKMRLNVDGEILNMDEAHFSVVKGPLKVFW